MTRTAAAAGAEVEGLQVATRGRVLELTIDRPERRNALTGDVIAGMLAALDGAVRGGDVRAVLLTGAGDRAFCAGFDIAMIDSLGGADVGAERDLVDDLASRVRELPLPVVAAVNGAAVGAGCDLAIACDLRLSADGARFGMPPARLGILYGWRGMQRLLQAVGLAAAKELLLTGALIGAGRAEELGLVSRVVTRDRLLAEARDLAETIADNAPLSVWGSKRSLDLLASRQLTDEELSALTAIQEQVWGSADAEEGARAYRERRPPRYTGA